MPSSVLHKEIREIREAANPVRRVRVLMRAAANGRWPGTLPDLSDLLVLSRRGKAVGVTINTAPFRFIFWADQGASESGAGVNQNRRHLSAIPD